MTALLDRPASAPSPSAVRPPSRLARWWGGWRVALRLARRDAWRGKGRALLVVLLIALPVAAATGVIVDYGATTAVTGPLNQAALSLGDVADARIVLAGAPVAQSVDATQSRNSDQPPVSTAAVLAALPAGSRVVSAGSGVDVVLESGPWGVTARLGVQDLHDPLNAGRWQVVQGRLPSSAAEIAITADQRARLQTTVGSRVTLTTTSGQARTADLAVVGVVAPVSPWGGLGGFDGVVLPGSIGDHSEPGELLAQIPRALSWSDVRAVNAAGGIVVSRSVLASPPSFCRSNEICLDHGPDPAPRNQPPSETQLTQQARNAALAGVVLVLVVLQIALLAGPAFAVQLRRRQRELGLVGVTGGDARVLRRTVLASGVVLGLAGAVLGVVVGWTVVWLLGGALPWAPLAQMGLPLGVPALPWYVAGVVAVGVISAIAAALVPAVVAGRGDVVDSLRGRRPLPPIRTRTPVAGVSLAVAGVLLLIYGRSVSDPLVLGLGLIGGELGLVLMMPWLVVRVVGLAGRLPLSPRLALRDAGRHRLRTATAACAIAAAAGAAVASSTWSTSQHLQAGSGDVTYVEGTLLVRVFPLDPTAAPEPGSAARVVGLIDQVAPGSRMATLRTLVAARSDPRVAASGGLGAVTCVLPTAGPLPTTGSASGDLAPCPERTVVQGQGVSFATPAVLLDDPDDLPFVLGPLAPTDAAIATLRAGGAVVLVPDALDPSGRVWLRPEPATYEGVDATGQHFDPPVALAATTVLSGAIPAKVIVGPKALAPGGALAGAAEPDPLGALVLVAPPGPDRADRPTTADRIQIAGQKARIGVSVESASPPPDAVGLVLAAAAGATLLMALLAGLMVTALAMADGRPDLVTLSAVGAPPGVRRRIAASSAGFVAALGCAAGVVSGLVVAKLLVGLFTFAGGRVFEVRWPLVATVLVVIPLVTAGAAWLTTRSRVIIPRRTDS